MKIILNLILLLAVKAQALELKLIGETIMPHSPENIAFKLGGLSGLHYDEKEKMLYAVCDDRGKYGEPRFYKINVETKDWSFKVKEAIYVKNKEGKRFAPSILDLEDITVLPWGNFLFSSEGDNNQKPRIPPSLFEVKRDGTWVRDYEVPPEFLPELSGEQKNGIQNNYGFEGSQFLGSASKLFIMNENMLVQDKVNFAYSKKAILRLQTLTSAEQAWTLKPKETYLYEYDTYEVKKDLGFGVSEILPVNDKSILVMERGAWADEKGVQTSVKIYDADMSSAENVAGTKINPAQKYKFMKKTLVLDFDKLKTEFKKVNHIDNFEGITWGPTLADGTKTLIVVSDDNFSPLQETIFLVFAVKN